MLTSAILYAGLLPLFVSSSIAFVMQRTRSPSPIIWPIAITGGFLTGQFTLRGQSGFTDGLHTFFQPHEAVDWLPHIVLLALGVSIVINLAPARRPRLIALAAALCLAAPVRLLSGNLAQNWSIPGKVAVLASLAAVLGFVWLLLASNDDEQPAILNAVLTILVAVGTAIVLTKSGVFTYGLSCGALGAAVAGTSLAAVPATGSASAWRRVAFSGTRGASGIITFSLGNLIILGHFYAELSTTNAFLLFLSLTATAAPLPALLRSGPAWQRNAARVVLCLLPLAIGVGRVVT